MKKTYKKWTEDERKFITENYGKYSCPELSVLMNIPVISLERFIQGNGIKRSTNQRQHDVKTSAFKGKYRNYKGNANNRGYKFDLTLEEFIALTSKPCFYCNEEPQKVNPLNFNSSGYSEGFKAGTEIDFNGIDRVNNNKGYSLDNCVTCCKLCNKMKGTLTSSEFKSHILKIACKYGSMEDLVKLKD